MSNRNPEYQFIPTDTEAVVALLAAMYETITGVAVKPASPERLFIQWIASIIIQERVLNNYTGNQNIPSRAEGQNLDALAELTYIKSRPEAKAAVCKMRFSISEPQTFAVLIPAGTRITDASNSLVWETTEDHHVPIGETSIEAEARCQTVGMAGNGYAIGQISKLVDVYDYYSECGNVTVSAGGSDVPDDDAFYELMRESMDAYSCAGSRGSYIYFAKKTSTEIGDVVANTPQPGYVDLYVLMKDGTVAPEQIKANVLAECSMEEVRPMTDFVSVKDPGIVEYNIRLTYYVPSKATRSTAQLQAAVDAAVKSYISWQCGKLGRDINPSYLVGLLMDTGVKRVVLEEPAFTVLQDGTYGTVPQVAQLKGLSVTNGGFEDE